MPVTRESFPAVPTFGKITITTAGSRVQGPNVQCPGGIILQCDPDGTGKACYGDSTVVYGTGVGVGGKLIAGAAASFDPGLVDNLNSLFFDASANSTVVYYTAFH
jgi:hypothetical protein